MYRLYFDINKNDVEALSCLETNAHKALRLACLEF